MFFFLKQKNKKHIYFKIITTFSVQYLSFVDFFVQFSIWIFDVRVRALEII